MMKVSETVTSIYKSNPLSFEEVSEILPLVVKWTKEASEKVDPLLEKIEELSLTDQAKAEELEKTMDEKILSWTKKVETLGGSVKGLWAVEFKEANGLWSWRYPESQIMYWRPQDTPFSQRKKISLKDSSKFLYSKEELSYQ